MQRRMMYVEQGTGYNHDGPAWIGYVQFSRTGRVAYFNGQCFQRAVGPNGAGNHFNLETGDTYWISGVKKRGSNRHVFGRGKVLVSRDALAEFLSTKGWEELDETHYGLFDAQPTDVAKFTTFQNTKLGS